MIWNYKIDLINDALPAAAKKRGVEIPEDLKNFIIEHNAASPANTRFIVGDSERIFGAVLSFNEHETEADSAYVAFDTIEDKSLIPFGIDPFGNLICYHINDGRIVFWEHETNRVVSTEKSLSEFIGSLY